MSARETLENHPFTAGFPPALRERLVPLARTVTFEPGETILRQGRLNDRFLLLTDGQAAIQLGSPARVMQTLRGGEVIGWSWLLEPFEGAFDVVCQEPITALELDGAKLRLLMEGDHELGYHLSKGLLGVLASRLQASRLRLLDLYAPRPRR